MSNAKTARPRMYHIDGIKGLMCFLIMIGHFWNIYRGCSGESPFDNVWLDKLNDLFGKNLLSATFWLYAFLVISGYLVSGTRIRSVQELLVKSVKRFLRFFLPVLGACVFIYALQELVGFYTEDTKAYFTNAWYQKYYATDLSWKAVLTESVRTMTSAACRFNSPFWVIRDIFVSSLLIYVGNFTDHVMQKKVSVLPVLFLLCAIVMDNHVMIACLAGYLVGYFREPLAKLTEKTSQFLVISVAVYGLFCLVRQENALPDVFDNIASYVLLHCFLLILVNRLEGVQKFFSHKVFLQMSKISFGVYSFHWPVICSVGSLTLIVGLESQWNALLALLAAFAVSVICTVIMSVAYLFTVEKLTTVIVNRVRMPKMFDQETN